MQSSPGIHRVHQATNAMGTRFEFVLEGEDSRRLADVAQEMVRVVESWHVRLSAFDASSELSSLARRAKVRPVVVDPDVFSLLALCESVREASGGAFDVCVGHAMHAGGFRGEPARDARAVPALELDARARTMRLVGVENQGRCPIDLGGVAKGFALERCVDIARDHGVARAFLHAGTSSVVQIGTPDAEIRVRLLGGEASFTPRAGTRLSVSAPRGRTVAGRGHILDPRTGESAEGIETVAVLGDCAIVAEAWSTALIVLGARPPAFPAELTTCIEHADSRVEISGPLRDTVRVVDNAPRTMTHEGERPCPKLQTLSRADASSLCRPPAR